MLNTVMKQAERSESEEEKVVSFEQVRMASWVGVATALLAVSMLFPAVAQSKEVTVVGEKLKFHPDTVTVSVNETVVLHFKNKGFISHSFHINELDVHSETISPDESTSVTFTVEEAGEYSFTCEVAEHKKAGMVGTLVVEDTDS